MVVGREDEVESPQVQVGLEAVSSRPSLLLPTTTTLKKTNLRPSLVSLLLSPSRKTSLFAQEPQRSRPSPPAPLPSIFPRLSRPSHLPSRSSTTPNRTHPLSMSESVAIFIDRAKVSLFSLRFIPSLPSEGAHHLRPSLPSLPSPPSPLSSSASSTRLVSYRLSTILLPSSLGSELNLTFSPSAPVLHLRLHLLPPLGDLSTILSSQDQRKNLQRYQTTGRRRVLVRILGWCVSNLHLFFP